MSNVFDIKSFRRALGQFPTGVTVVTTTDDAGNPVGVTASSFNSVSIDPPLVLWSVDKGAFSAPIFESSQHFAVNVLSKDQVATSNKFAGRGEDKFAGVAYHSNEDGCPLLDDYAAQFECKTWNVYEGGDHLIIVGEVTAYRHEESTAPLVFSGGSYAISMQHPSIMKRDQLEVKTDGFLSDYLPYLLHVAFTRSSSGLYPRLKQHGGVAPEEWRVFTILSDGSAIAQDDLAQMVMQPENIFEVTVQWMVDNGHIHHDGEGRLKLTSAGLALSSELIAIAREDEASVLKVLSEDESVALKQSLKVLGRGEI